MFFTAESYPHPTYKWYKEEYIDDVLRAVEIDPLKEARYTVSGGTLVISQPDSVNVYLIIEYIVAYVKLHYESLFNYSIASC